MKLFPAIGPGPVMSFVQAVSDCHHLIATIEKHRSVENQQALGLTWSFANYTSKTSTKENSLVIVKLQGPSLRLWSVKLGVAGVSYTRIVPILTGHVLQ